MCSLKTRMKDSFILLKPNSPGHRAAARLADQRLNSR